MGILGSGPGGVGMKSPIICEDLIFPAAGSEVGGLVISCAWQ